MSEPVAQVVEVWSGIQGEGPLVGVRQVFVRLAGCNLDCDYCDTPGAHGWTAPAEVEARAGSMRFSALPNPVSASRLAAEALRLARDLPHHSVSWTGGEPLWSPGFLEAAIPPLREAGLAQFLETNGTLPEALERVIGLFDFVSMDVKSPDLCRGLRDLEPCRRFAEVLAASGRPGCLKLVLAESTAEEMVREAAALAALTGRTLVLQPMSPIDSGPQPPSAGQVLQAQALALGLHADVRVIPQTHRALGLR